jgi:pimeloyl-ACP methyl ester carboxylesterase
MASPCPPPYTHPMAAAPPLHLVAAPVPGGGRPASFWRRAGGAAPGKAPVLALAGLGLDGRAFASFAARLPDRDWILANLPNDLPAASMEEFARCALGILDAAGHAGRPAVLLGSSFGGMVAAEAARIAPGRAAALVLLGSAPGGGSLGFRMRAAAALHPWIPRRPYPQILARVLAPALPGSDPALREALRVQMRHRDKAFVGACLRALRGFDAIPGLRNLAAPLLVVHGERDPVFPPAAGAALAAAAPRATRVLLPGCGHLPHLTREEETARILAEFLAREGR